MQINPWYYTHTGQRQGPVSDDEMRQLIIERKINPENCSLWQEGMSGWVSIKEIEAFQATFELIERLDKQSQSQTQKSYCSIGAILDARRKNEQKKQGIFYKYPSLGFGLRICIALFGTALTWAWFNEYAPIPYWGASILCIFVTLVFAGPCTERSYRQRSFAGGACALSFVLAWYLAYLTNHGAKVGESLISSMFINQPIAFLMHYIDAGRAVIILATFTFPFLFIGLFYRLPWRVGGLSTGSFGDFDSFGE